MFVFQMHVCFCGLSGTDMVGQLGVSGIGTPLTVCKARPSDALKQGCVEHNGRLTQVLREDEHSEWLMAATTADARLGRMTAPVIWDGHDDQCLVHPRFASCQIRPDGSVKRRAVDNFSWSPTALGKEDSANGFTVIGEKMTHDTLDALSEASSLFVDRVGEVPGLFKADIDAAYRRIPIKKEHRWIAGIAFKMGGLVYKAMHFASPFGAVASGNAWERIGAAIGFIASFFLYLPLLRYVDDYFGPERLESMHHAMTCFARLVRALLGAGSIADNKLECGRGLCILGVDISMSRRGFQCRPAAGKIPKWVAIIDAAVAPGGCLMPGIAGKLAGKLSWGCSLIFRRMGRAMLRPIFDQKSLRSGNVCFELRRALLWWRRILLSDIAELKPWLQNGSKHAHMFCDAAGGKPHLGVVVFIDGEILWTHLMPPQKVMSRFKSRGDNQIMGLELLAISLGISTFGRRLHGRKVVIHSDNTGSEVPVSFCTHDV